MKNNLLIRVTRFILRVELFRELLQRVLWHIRIQLLYVEVPQPLGILQRILFEDMDAEHVFGHHNRHLSREVIRVFGIRCLRVCELLLESIRRDLYTTSLRKDSFDIGTSDIRIFSLP